MGTDIHVRIEKKVGAETVAIVDGEIRVIPEGEEWQPGEKLVENPWRQQFIETHLAEGGDLKDQLFVDDLADLPTHVVDERWYAGRNYSLFARLAEVRWYPEEDGAPEPLDEPRGLPDDVSQHVELDLDWLVDSDLYSHSYFTLTELLEGFSQDEYPHFFSAILRMKALAERECGGDTDKVRMLFAFDN